MFELPLAYINQAEREREVDADLRRRQMLKPRPSSIEGSGAVPMRMANPPTQVRRVRAVER